MSEDHLLSVRDVGFTYANGTIALKDVCLEVPAGCHFGLLGPNGCGKTTLLKIIGGHIPPTSGDVYLADVNITRVAPQARSVTTVFQELGLFPHLDVAQNIAFGIRCKGNLRGGRASAEARQWISRMGLDSIQACKPQGLSTGLQQKVAITRALAVQPALWLLDEPTSALDGLERARLIETLNNAHEHSWYRAAMVVTHDLPFAFAVCDLIALMDHGRIVQVGTPAELVEHPADSWVAHYLGIYNVIDGEIRPDGLFHWSGTSVISHAERGTASPSARHRLLLRTDRLKLVEHGECENVFECQIERVELGLYGPLLRVTSGMCNLRLRLPETQSHRIMRIGESVQVGFQNADTRLVVE